MSGMKNETDILKDSTVFDPQMSRINFAYPSENILAEINPFDHKLHLSYKSGILEPMIKYKAEKEIGLKSYV